MPKTAQRPKARAKVSDAELRREATLRAEAKLAKITLARMRNERDELRRSLRNAQSELNFLLERAYARRCELRRAKETHTT